MSITISYRRMMRYCVTGLHAIVCLSVCLSVCVCDV